MFVPCIKRTYQMATKEYRILLVDDEPDILEFLSYNLRKEAYQVETALSGVQAMEIAQSFKPHLVLLDVMMPEMDGVETCEQLRQIIGLERTVIAFLTARSEDYSQVAAFEAGGDDYIAKPIKPRVLLSRVKALLKRYNWEPVNAPLTGTPTPIADGLIIDKEKYVVTLNGREFDLPKKEFELLCLMASRPEKVFTREEIFQSVWDDNIVVGDRTIDVHIRKLREKIGEDRIRTIKGVGYKFIPD